VFHTDIAKVDKILQCCNDCTHMLQACVSFYLFFHTYVISVFIWMLHMFHTYIVNVLSGCFVCLQWFSIVFVIVSDACFNCFICFFYVVSVASRCFKSISGLHMVCAWEGGGGACGPCAGNVQAARPPARARVMQAQSSDVRVMRAHAWTHKTEEKTNYSRRRPSRRPDATSIVDLSLLSLRKFDLS
jgi:hypothetical protein